MYFWNHSKNQTIEYVFGSACLSDFRSFVCCAQANNAIHFYRRQSTSVCIYYYLFKFESKSRLKNDWQMSSTHLSIGTFVVLLEKKVNCKVSSTGWTHFIHVYSSTIFVCVLYRLRSGTLAHGGWCVCVCLFTVHWISCNYILGVPIIVNHTIEIEIIVIKCILWCSKLVRDRNRATYSYTQKHTGTINMLQW